MYTYDKSTGLVRKIEVSIDRANDYSPNSVDEFLYNGAIVTQRVGKDMFSNISNLIANVNGPIYIKPNYHVVEEKFNEQTNYFVTNSCTYSDIPVSFNVKDVMEQLYIVEDISFGDEGHQPYYLMTNLIGNTIVRYISDFAEKFERGDMILYTFKF